MKRIQLTHVLLMFTASNAKIWLPFDLDYGWNLNCIYTSLLNILNVCFNKLMTRATKSALAKLKIVCQQRAIGNMVMVLSPLISKQTIMSNSFYFIAKREHRTGRQK